jgi:hypothetical protein
MDEHEFRRLVLLSLEAIMADLTKLNAAVAANTQAVTDVTAVVAAGSTADQAGVDAATAQIETNTAALEALKTPPAA